MYRGRIFRSPGHVPRAGRLLPRHQLPRPHSRRQRQNHRILPPHAPRAAQLGLLPLGRAGVRRIDAHLPRPLHPRSHPLRARPGRPVGVVLPQRHPRRRQRRAGAGHAARLRGGRHLRARQRGAQRAPGKLLHVQRAAGGRVHAVLDFVCQGAGAERVEGPGGAGVEGLGWEEREVEDRAGGGWDGGCRGRFVCEVRVLGGGR